ncbi:M48 family metalloprotease [Desulfosarcina sp.]|uniref:M48 family metalloprotease n=1 Tax=Desulfosarcina sp. TaxID=2027861 RepID=UPI0029A7C593|nr:M48 family metalloprotease [Desulfosarcina sp.]MDX2452271.1 M48 family metalloprotease [Desulfosarcina sp.]MDX2490051.1 M48 family metalloprotease [Desulfosarcina sp.]
MPIKNKKLTIVTMAAFLISTIVITVPEGICLTIQEEREMSSEFMAVVRAQFPLIEDPVINDYVNRVGKRILAAIPPQPFDYQFHVLREDVYNAFATPAGHIFFNSGLFAALDSEDELAGIIGHEIAHVVCRHISDRIESSKKIGMATLAGMVAGVLLGAGGAGAAASAVTVGSVAAGQTAALAYSRDNEMQADQLGLEYLALAGYSGEGLLTSLKKIRSKQWYGSEQIPTYLTTHPASEARMSTIDNWLHQNRSKSVKKFGEVGGFDLAHTRLIALYTDEKLALKRFKTDLEASPESPLANYGYALALTRVDQWHNAAVHMKRAIEGNAMTTSMLQDLGIIYFHDGQYEKAMEALSASSSEKDPESKLYLGRTQMELGRMAEAIDTFENLVRYNEGFTQAYYYLGESSGRLGDMFSAHYNLGRFYRQKGDLKNAGFHLNRALKLAVEDSQKQMVELQLKTLGSQKEKKSGAG